MPKTFAKTIDDLPLLEIPLGIFASAVLVLELPGMYIDSAWWVLPLAIAAFAVPLIRALRNARAGLIALALGLAVFTGMHAFNRLAERKPPIVEMMEVVSVDPPHGKNSGSTTFKRPGQTEVLSIPSGWHAQLGKPLPLAFHEGALGLRWVEER